MNAILSIKPKYAEKIYSGEKTVEFRKCYICSPIIMYLYETSPVKSITGYIFVNNGVKDTKDYIWNKCSELGGISKIDFDEYYNNQKYASAYFINKVVKFTKSIKLPAGIRRPQSYCYTHIKFEDYV